MVKIFENATDGEIGWVAGLFEGEGCITIQYGKYPEPRTVYPYVTLKMSDKDVVQRFYKIVGRGSRYTQERPSPRKDMYEWNLFPRAEVQEFIAIIWPYLGERRRARATELKISPA